LNRAPGREIQSSPVTALLLADDRWGTWPDWLAAVGTLGAFFVTYLLLRKEQHARREYEKERREAQARLISAWLDLPLVPTELVGSGRIVELPRVEMVFKNASDEAVYHVRVTVVPRDGLFASDPDAAPWPSAGTARGTMQLLPPGETIRRPAPEISHQFDSLALGLSFNDARGHRWKRLPNGSLEGPPEPRRSVKDRLDASAKGLEQELEENQ
jgi:hypothetical protein